MTLLIRLRKIKFCKVEMIPFMLAKYYAFWIALWDCIVHIIFFLQATLKSSTA